MECKYSEKSETSGFDLEKTIKSLSLLFFGVGTVIYSFTLGYFHRLEIPDSPSFIEAIRFYAINTLRNLCASPELLWGLILMFGTIWLGKEANSGFKGWKRWGSILACAIVFSLPIIFMEDAIKLFAPVILSVVFASIIYIVLENKSLDKETKALSLLGFAGLILSLSLWSFSVLDLSYFSQRSLNRYFPNGFGVKPYEPSNLLWTGDEKRFWYSCQESKGILYGTIGEEKIFVRTEMSTTLFKHFCIMQNSTSK